VRCGRCGNDNAEANRFCGMCGAPLVAKAQAAGQTPGVGPAGSTAGPRQPVVPAPTVSRQAPQTSHVGLTGVDTAPMEGHPAFSSSHAESRTGPVITGPSFLGLNTPVAGGGRGLHRDHHDSSSGRDPLQPSSGNLDYLLNDEEEPKGGGGRLLLVVVALALAVGFGYLHWKRGGFDWLNAGDKKAAVTKPTPDSTPSSSDPGGAPGTAATPNSSTPPAASNAPAAPIPTDGAAANSADSTANTATSQTASQAAPPQGAPSQAAPPVTSSDPGAAPDSAARPATSDSDQQSDEEEPPAAAKAVPRKPAPAKPSAARAYDPVNEAERYIYGRGVRQDCDHGLRVLKSSADQSNPKAMISLGALYSTGTCTPRDLPTAYRWFALALHKQPDNQALQNDLQKLWSQMTQPERQLAIKLSQ